MKQLIIDIKNQKCFIMKVDQVISEYLISTACLGTGQEAGSFKTPLGQHVICEKIGEQAPINAVFRGRVFTGEIFNAPSVDPKDDWILTRILWLSGREPGYNLGGRVDTKARYIYIHGTPDCEPMGVPKSHGCIRMRNCDIVRLFDSVEVGTPVVIR